MKWIRRMNGVAGVLFLTGAVFVAGAAVCRAEDNAKKTSPSDDVRSRIPRDDFVVHVHRGAGSRFSENTLEACEKSWTQPGAIPECDVRTSKDGVFFAFHDDDLTRVVKDASPEMKKKRVNDMTWDELARLDVGAFAGEKFAGQHPAKIEEVFAAMQNHPRRFVCLDFKEAALDRLASLVRKYDIEKQVVFATTLYDKICEWKRLCPQSQTLYWMGGKEEVLAKRIADLERDHFLGVTQLEIHVQVGDMNAKEPFVPSPAFLRSVAKKLREHNILFVAMPWSCANPQAYQKMLEFGADAFSTDYPDEVKQVLDTYYGKK